MRLCPPKADRKNTFDDALDVFPTHGLGGIVGTVLTGIFAYDFFAAEEGAEMISRNAFFWNHILALLIVFVYTFVMSYCLYWLTNKMIPMRVSPKSERMGLDRSQHDEEYATESTGLAEDTPSEFDWWRGMENS